jgi:signal transduction histidine kinase
MDAVRILIVDDRPENLVALEAILGNRGLSLVRATSGREALKALLAQDFALVLLDIAMPDLDGYETAALIRGHERLRLTPIIFITANSPAAAQVSRGYSVGAVDYLFKPVVPEVLISKVNVFVELYHNRQTLKEQAAQLRSAYDEMEQRVLERTSALAASKLEAETMNRMKDEFLATLSHELRTPLNAILGWIHILEGGKRDDALIARAIRVIRRSAQAQAELVTHILDVSRIIGGKLSLHLGDVDVAAVLGNTLESVQPAAVAKGISIRTCLDGSPRLIADQDRLQQVMWNLLSNAIKFTPKGGQVSVESTATADDVTIIVADNGIGIDPDFLPRVFHRFSQADATQSRSQRGLGLGMAIVRHLVEMHGGAVTVDSPGINQGTTVTVVLPIRTLPAHIEADRGAQPTAMPSESAALASLEGISVLVVDDEEDARDVLTLILENRGAIVRAVSSSDAALESLSQRLPDVLVSDIGMPGVDGHSFLRKLRTLDAEQGGRVPAIALTAYATAVDAAKARAAGFDRHVAKPVTPAEIVDVVAVMAARRQ